MNKFAAILLALCLIGWWQSQPAKVNLPAGAKAPKPPVQTTLKNAQKFYLNDYQLEPLALFELDAKVLSKKRYRTDRGAQLAPYDLALGWGVMSDQSVVDSLSIRQTNRWYMYRTKGNTWLYPMEVIGQSSANMHMVPIDNAMQRHLDKIRVGSIVRITGKLVAITHSDGFRWKSSLTRDDRGGGACELIYLESLTVLVE